MFEPDYTETMSMLLDTINRQRNNILPAEKLDDDIAQFMKSQNELFIANRTEKSENEYKERSPISTPKQIFEYNMINKSEEKKLDLADRIIEDHRNEV